MRNESVQLAAHEACVKCLMEQHSDEKDPAPAQSSDDAANEWKTLAFIMSPRGEEESCCCCVKKRSFFFSWLCYWNFMIWNYFS